MRTLLQAPVPILKVRMLWKKYWIKEPILLQIFCTFSWLLHTSSFYSVRYPW